MGVEIFINSLVDIISQIYHSAAVAVIKFLLGIYLAVLVVDIILLAIDRGIGANIRFLFYGGHIPAELAAKKSKTRKKWNNLLKMLGSGRQADWKIMIIKADEMIGQLIKKLGYSGDNFGEILDKINPGQIENIEELKEAHSMRNKIIHEENLQITREQAKEIMDKYENFLQIFEV